MIDNWLTGLSETLSQNLWIGLIIAFIAGVITSFAPCSIANFPLVIGYMSGCADNKKKACLYSILFCIGLTIVFVALGVVAAFVGRLFLGIQMYWYIFLGFLMIIMALQSWGVLHLFARKQKKQPKNGSGTEPEFVCDSAGQCGYTTKGKGAFGAFLTGMISAVFSSPCSTPVLIAIMAIVSTGQSVVMGVLMLLLYSLGHSVLLILAGTSVGFVKELSNSTKFQKVSKALKIFIGVVLLAFSGFLFWLAFA